VIPTIFLGSGDIPTAKKYVGLGRKLLDQLRASLSFQKLPTGRTQPFYCGDGTTIKCVINHGVSRVFIHSQIAGEEDEYQECLCTPHFSMAVITAIDPAEPTESFLKTGRMKYDVQVCTMLTYIKAEGVYDANFGKYSAGQIVLVSIGAEMTEWNSPLDCDRFCLMQRPRFDVLQIVPIDALGAMQLWKEPTEEEEDDV